VCTTDAAAGEAQLTTTFIGCLSQEPPLPPPLSFVRPSAREFQAKLELQLQHLLLLIADFSGGGGAGGVTLDLNTNEFV
jgi:hypothetical protein